jgi:hypothetical protein
MLIKNLLIKAVKGFLYIIEEMQTVRISLMEWLNNVSHLFVDTNFYWSYDVTSSNNVMLTAPKMYLKQLGF